MIDIGRLAIRAGPVLVVGALAMAPVAASADCQPSLTVNTPSLKVQTAAPPLQPVLPGTATKPATEYPATQQPSMSGPPPVSAGSGPAAKAPPPSTATQGTQQPLITQSRPAPAPAPPTSSTAAVVSSSLPASHAAASVSAPVTSTMPVPTTRAPAVQLVQPAGTVAAAGTSASVNLRPVPAGRTLVAAPNAPAAGPAAGARVAHAAPRDPLAPARGALAGLMATSVLGGLIAAMLLLTALVSRGGGPGGPLRLRGA